MVTQSPDVQFGQCQHNWVEVKTGGPDVLRLRCTKCDETKEMPRNQNKNEGELNESKGKRLLEG